ncbi:glycosyltransferase family 2 protein [Leeuwenhoekiella parthenopeia]|uniref:Glycosyltransferase family 2 protein n=1 Tax=Leeuwenhoekiella parthenopeia TaxID=2890320 RepID=A0ABS8GYB4_9FLAO|nr:glycosyltransferase [Leeuwenhoekiella parthenopeia]MCC4214660.1 glycosyltransferase family 2 protein [Leeuwenhoekiella parthenopeia]
MNDLAIVIPFYKIQFFEKTLTSLSSQTDKRFNIYIGDDASPENPRPLIEKFSSYLKFNYTRFQSNLGSISLSKQWDRCISLSNDEPWLMILGDDDWLSPNYVECFYKHKSEFDDVNIVRYASYEIDFSKKRRSKLYTHPILEDAPQSFWRKCIYESRSSLTEYVFKRTVYEKYGFFDYDLAWCSDDHAWLVFSEEQPIYSINEAFANIGVSSMSITGQDHMGLRKSIVKIEFYKFLLKNYSDCYNSKQINFICGRLENEILGNRYLELSEFIFLVKLRFNFFEWYQFKKFLKKVFRSFYYE